jgi:hypothetical protein
MILQSVVSNLFWGRVSGGTYGIQGGSRRFYIEVMEGYVKIVWQATPKFFDSIMFRAVRGAILESLNNINHANFF